MTLSNRRDGVVVIASASQSMELEFIFQIRVIPKDFKIKVTQLGAQFKKGIVRRTSRQAGQLLGTRQWQFALLVVGLPPRNLYLSLV